MSLAVTGRGPEVFKGTVKLSVPATRGALTGKMALASLEVIPTVSVAPGIRFQFASTALTVMLKAEPAICAAGVPVLPAVLPGEGVSPGTRTCSFEKAP